MKLLWLFVIAIIIIIIIIYLLRTQNTNTTNEVTCNRHEKAEKSALTAARREQTG